MDLRKKLIDFEKWQQQQLLIPDEAEKVVDLYLKSINCDLDETQTVRQNEDAESICLCPDHYKTVYTFVGENVFFCGNCGKTCANT
tara:strand:- start:271 stop:528 length:258 start_codon:yes stop_codon:yes gene_type:complete